MKSKTAISIDDNESTHLSHRHEDSFCPVTCPMSELEAEIESMNNHSDNFANYGQFKFLEGVRHARIILAAASGGKIGR